MLLFDMSMESGNLKSLIAGELRNVHDDRVVHHVQGLLVEPRAEFRDWDYGAPNERYLCWIVLEHESGTGIAYCEGFGPRCPWGLVSTSGERGGNSIGQDCGWFPAFVEAYFESFAATSLPIWRVFSSDGGWPGLPLTDELSWTDAWKRCEAALQGNPGSRFSVHHTIHHGTDHAGAAMGRKR
jgi:hypothetical protein